LLLLLWLFSSLAASKDDATLDGTGLDRAGLAADARALSQTSA
jgi:hypothetical protein